MIALRHKTAQSAFIICFMVFLPAYASGESAPSGIHWAFVKPQRPSTPPISNTKWPCNDIDRFVLKQIEDSSLQPSVETGARTLIRRLHFDLTGLPPTPADISAFENDSKADLDSALEKLVDRLLSSPHFGEKWARWWMDLAHYGDSDGYLTDQLRPVAWRWRQWVVEAFNRNLPFDRFTIEQLAGDLLPGATTQQRIATGFLRNTLSNREGGADLEEFRVLQVKDRTSTLGTVWLGLTLQCAECHDHKHDPFPQEEFYRLYAFFNNADELNINAPLPGESGKSAPAKIAYDRKRHELLEPVSDRLEALQKRWEAKLLDTENNPGRDHHWDRELELLGLIWGGNLGEGQLEGLNILSKPWTQRTPIESARLQDYFLRKGSRIDEKKFKELRIDELVEQLGELETNLPPITRAPTIVKHHVYRPTHLHTRGNFRRPGKEMQPATPGALHPLQSQGTPNRLALARWVISADNPLAARVVVNRLWQEIFGRALVITPDDFGIRGARPSHPGLLDWLATEFIRRDWDTKAMLRLMVTSATYRQSASLTPASLARDPDNVLLTRYTRQRLSAELVRDNALAVSGLLNRRIGGPSVRPPQPESVIKESFSGKWEVSEGPDRHRRGLYTFIQRSAPFAQSVTFDFPDNTRPCTRRIHSNTPLQALSLLNDPVFFEAAQALAARLLQEGSPSTHERLYRAFFLCLARAPLPSETARLEKYLAAQTDILRNAPEEANAMAGKPIEGLHPPVQAAWVGVASILLNLDEFVTKQ
ncbi:MAG TPA: hypothetical protein DCS85_09760 [Verrucomicrobiales bacterium]|nr:hypothetical protein [Verrucomicrobiales bacterium]